MKVRKVVANTIILFFLPFLVDGSPAQISHGDEFTFIRIKYNNGGENYRYRNLFGPGFVYWAVDYPFAEENFIKRVKKYTSLKVAKEALALSLDDPQIFNYSFAYVVEVGYMSLSQHEAEVLREWLLRGGFLIVDDFHGPYEWNHFLEEMKKVFPEKPLIDIPADHPIFHCYYDFNKVPQIPGLGSWLRGRTYEKGGYFPHCKGIFDDQGRLMVLVNHNTDIGDSWEHAEDPRYPAEYSFKGFKLGINFIIYALTH